MSAEVLPHPTMIGPCGLLMDELLEQEDILRQCLDEMPFGITDDPRAAPSDETVNEFGQAAALVRQANETLERIIEREAKYSLDNGWTIPGDD